MPNVKIVTDSSAGLTEDEIKQHNIAIVPLSVMIDGTVYVERETITKEEFMTKMSAAESLPKTSQPPLGKFVDLFDELGKDGSKVVSINMMKSISGTVEAARQAAQMSSADVTVVDSQTTDRGLAFQVLAAAKLAETGASVDEIVAETIKVRDHSRLFMGVIKLDNLVAGGRISRAVGLVSNLLNIKIGLEVINGEIEVTTKGRGMKTISKFLDNAYAEMQKAGHIVSVGVAHAGAPETAAKIAAHVEELFPDIKVVVLQTVPIIATHAGEGAFALMYYTD
ncbi:DegV family protein [Furfurilactobacillus sp. WILCCON 0119]|uniref:DegV family protein n=1 Tax=Furfurilactobacillus entadae TaxID=2922307 RepID=UPI0038B296F4